VFPSVVSSDPPPHLAKFDLDRLDTLGLLRPPRPRSYSN